MVFPCHLFFEFVESSSSIIFVLFFSYGVRTSSRWPTRGSAEGRREGIR
jgi:hypothetical protein